jgi:acyl-CoA thioesterase-1
MLAATLAVALFGCGNRAPEPKPAGTPAVIAVPKVDPRPIIAAFGDSLSAGLGLDPGKAYPDDLQRLLDAAGYSYHVVNMGVSGDTTSDGVERLPSVTAMRPQIVILEFGANDGLRGQPVAAAKQNMARMIETLRDSGATILLAGMTLPRNYGAEYIVPFDQMYVDLASQYKVARIPFLLDGVGGIPQLTQPDGLHPTAEGAEIMAHTVMKWLQPLLRR